MKSLGLRRYLNLNRRYLGMAWTRQNVIFVTRRHDTIEGARKLLHTNSATFGFPYLSHGQKFDGLIERLLNGEQFKGKETAARQLS